AYKSATPSVRGSGHSSRLDGHRRRRFLTINDLQRLLRRHRANILSDLHRAILRPAHAAEMRAFENVRWQRLVVHSPRRLRVERQAKLFVPIEGKAGLRERVVALARPGTLPR